MSPLSSDVALVRQEVSTSCDSATLFADLMNLLVAQRGHFYHLYVCHDYNIAVVDLHEKYDQLNAHPNIHNHDKSYKQWYKIALNHKFH